MSIIENPCQHFFGINTLNDNKEMWLCVVARKIKNKNKKTRIKAERVERGENLLFRLKK